MSRPESTVEAHDKGKDNVDLDSTDDRANQGLEKLGYKQELLRVWDCTALFACLPVDFSPHSRVGRCISCSVSASRRLCVLCLTNHGYSDTVFVS